jgi:ferredoxin-thioredoxin reductase catalytic chain
VAGKQYPEEVVKLYERLKKEAAEGGYTLNPDREFTLGLVEGLLANIKRFGYGACPCRLAYGEKAKDIDLVCPCYYRDDDLEEFGTCYCSLYVNDDWIEGRKPHKSIPDRRPPEFVLDGYSEPEPGPSSGLPPSSLSHPVWRCKVCGYLCARDEPPGKCPVCKASKDRFERFM